MVVGIILGALIAAYCIYIIIRRVKEIKKGNYCSCNCNKCSGCTKTKDDKDLT